MNNLSYYQKLLRIAFPIAAQEFVIMALNMVDIIMIGQKGEVAVASVALANQITFILLILLFGIGSSASVFTAQYWGKKDTTSIHKILGISLLIAIVSSALFFILSHRYPEQILGLYTIDRQVIALGSQYLKIACFGFIPVAITSTFSASLRSTQNVRLPMVTSILALSLKTLLNYGLIFGHFGLPELGVLGAAVATIVSRLVECTIIVYFSYRLKTPIAGKLKELLSFDRTYFLKYLKIGSPVIINELIWVLGITVYNMVYAHIGTESIAAYNIASSVEGLAFTMFIGLSHACAIIVGNQIGAEKYANAQADAKKSIQIAFGGALLFGVMEILMATPLLTLYKISPTSHTLAFQLLMVSGVTLWMRGCNMTLFIGIIRSGGDTKFGLLTELGTIWMIGVPLALIGAFVFHLSAPLVYLLVATEEALKLIIGFNRFRSMKWMNNLVTPGPTLQPLD
jgi:putative MATE family efflux protein